MIKMSVKKQKFPEYTCTMEYLREYTSELSLAAEWLFEGIPSINFVIIGATEKPLYKDLQDFLKKITVLSNDLESLFRQLKLFLRFEHNTHIFSTISLNQRMFFAIEDRFTDEELGEIYAIIRREEIKCQ
jgi:hypothetical protein